MSPGSVAKRSGKRGSGGLLGGRKSTKQPVEHSILLTATFCMLAFGAIMVYSASSVTSYLDGAGSAQYLERYAIFALLGLLVMRLMSRRGVDLSKRFGPLLLGASFFLLLAVLIPGVGLEANGARRWLGTGSLQLQPAEPMKLALVIYAAHLLASKPKLILDLRELASPLFLVVGAACALVILQPDLGTALVIGFTLCAMLVAAGIRLRHLSMLASSGAFLVLLVALVEPYRRERLTAFLHPWSDASGSGFQTIQAMIAIGSGGLTGVGLGESVQKVFYLPEAHTDLILAVIGEELGLLGMLTVLGLFGMIAYAGLRAAKRAPDRYQRLLGAGLVSLILTQATLNFFAVLGLAPLTGVPLPLISYGGTNLVVLLASMGVLLNIASRTAVVSQRKSGPIGVVEDGKVKRVVRTNKRRKTPSKQVKEDRAPTHSDSGGRYGRTRGPGTRRRRRSAG